MRHFRNFWELASEVLKSLLVFVVAIPAISLIVWVLAYLYFPVSVFDSGNLGSTITTIQGSDTLSASRSVINTNFSNLNTDKIQSGDTVASLTITAGTITTATIPTGTITLASTTRLSCLGSCAFGATATSSFSSTGKLTAVSATSTAFTATTYFELPALASLSTTIAGHCGLDTTSGQLRCGDGTTARNFGDGFLYSSVGYATSTWSGTTTIPLGPAFKAETWSSVKCFTDAGYIGVSFYDGTNRMNYFVASTTVGTVTFTSNNTFTAGESRYVDFGSTTPATKVACTVKRAIDAD